MECELAAGDGWRVCACPCGGSVAHAVPAYCARVGVAVVCGGFEGCSNAGVVHEWGEDAARHREPVGVERLVLVGFDVEEVCAADGEATVLVGELDHIAGRVGGICGCDLGGVAVLVGNVVAFLELAEFHPFPGAASFVGDVLALWCVVCVCGHSCFSCLVSRLRVKFVACRFSGSAPVLCALLPLVNSRLKQGGHPPRCVVASQRVPFVGVVVLFGSRPVVQFVGPYSRISFETSSAEEALASIGRVDRGALEAGLVDIRYGGRMGESLLPLLREREGVSVGE